MRTNCIILARSAGASILICSGLIERTLINIAYEVCVTFLLDSAIERTIPFDLQASPGNAGVMPWKPVLELGALQEVEAEEGIPGFGGLDVRVDRDVE